MIASCVHPEAFDEAVSGTEEWLIGVKGDMWNVGDRINLFDQAGSHCFTAVESRDGICFKGYALSSSEKVFALYPYDSLAKFNPKSNNITTSTPALKSAKQGESKNKIYIGQVIDNCIEFIEISGILKIEIGRNDVVSVEIISNDKSCRIAGKTEITATDDISETSALCAGSHLVCLRADDEVIPKGEYYFEAIPCTLTDGYSIRLCLSDGRTSMIKIGESYIIGKGINDLGVIDGVLDFDT